MHMHAHVLTLHVGVCPTLNNIANGATSLNSRFVGSVSNCSCNSGYGMVGSPTRTCLPYGIWSSRLPTCERETMTLVSCLYTAYAQ